MNDRQNDIQALTGPTIEEAIARMSNAGIAPHEIGQALILTGAGLLTAALGPKGAGYEIRHVSAATTEWLARIAAHLDRAEMH
jgi:hypothetical protein